MSAAEIIEQLKQLPESDRQKVREFLLDDGAASPEGNKLSDEAIQYIPRDVLEKTAEEIFTKHEKLFGSWQSENASVS